MVNLNGQLFGSWLMMYRRLFWLVSAALVLVLTSSACGRSGSEASDERLEPGSGQDSEPDGNVATITPIVGSDEEPVANPAPPPSGLSLNDTLGKLGAYVLEIGIGFEGEDASGAMVVFDFVGRETMLLEPPRMRLDLSAVGEDNLVSIKSVSLVREGDVAYLDVPGVGCVSGLWQELGAGMALPLDPRQVLDGLSDVQTVDSDVIMNGIETSEFHFDENALNWPDTDTGSWSIDGDVFVEKKRGLVRRAAMTVVGQGDLLGDGRVLDGTYDIVIDVREAQTNEAPSIPVACGEDIRYPILADAYDITAIEDLLTFKSRLPLVDVANFYLAEMPAAGWQLSSEPDIFEDLAILNFENDGAQMMITVDYDGDLGASTVLISP